MSELQINTTQNVKIMFTAAGAGERLLAFIIDMTIKIGYLMVLSWTFGVFENMDEWSQIGIKFSGDVLYVDIGVFFRRTNHRKKSTKH